MLLGGHFSAGIVGEVAQEGIFADTLEVGMAQGTWRWAGLRALGGGTLLEVAGRAACTAAADKTSFLSLRIGKEIT